MHVLTPNPSVHPPTFPHPDFHSPALLELLKLKVTVNFANYLADTVVDAIDTALGNKPTTWSRACLHPESKRVSSFKHFAQNFIRNASIGMPSLLVALVYITRSGLHISAECWSYKDVFLGALIVASKYTTDPSPRTVRWVRAAVIPGKQATLDIQHMNMVEHDFLGVLDWQLGFTQEDILLHYSDIVGLYTNREERPPKIPSPRSRIAMRPPTPYFPPKDNRTPIRMSTTSYNLPGPSTSSYPMAGATQLSYPTEGRTRHSHQYPSNLPSPPTSFYRMTGAMQSFHLTVGRTNRPHSYPSNHLAFPPPCHTSRIFRNT